MENLNQSCFVILGLLGKSPSTGYDLKKILSKMSKFYWSESNAQIYPVLKKLEQAKLVTAKVDKNSGARQKRIYAITKAGKAVLLDWLNKQCELIPYREEVLLKLAYGQHLKPKQIKQHLLKYKQQLEEKLAQFELVITHIKKEHKGRPDQRYLFMIYDHVYMILKTKLAWCEKMLKGHNILLEDFL